MNVIQKSETIKNGFRKGFQDGSSKMAKRKCYGYNVGPDSESTVNPEEAKVVRQERYFAGDSLWKIAAGLEKQGILSPTSKPKWNREAIGKLLSNQKYIGYIISFDDFFLAQGEKRKRSNINEHRVAKDHPVQLPECTERPFDLRRMQS